MQWLTRAVSSLSPDPSDTHRFASYESSSSGSTVRLWDTRKPGSEILSLEVNGAILGTGWLPGGSGMTRLGVGTKDGVGVWDIISGQTTDHDGIHDWTSLGEMRQGMSMHSMGFHLLTKSSAEAETTDAVFHLYHVYRESAIRCSLCSQRRVHRCRRHLLGSICKAAFVGQF